MNETIAKLHSVDFKTIGLEDYGKYENYMARQIHRWSKQYKDSETQHIPEIENLIEQSGYIKKSKYKNLERIINDLEDRLSELEKD